MDTMLTECSNFCLGSAAAAADNGTSVAHPSSGRGGQSGYETDNWFGYFFCNICSSFFFCCSADLADHDNTSGLRVGLKSGQAVNKVGAVDRVSANPEAGRLADGLF